MSTPPAGSPASPSDRSGKVVHVSVVHRANDVRVFFKECRTVAAAGYDVTLYACADEAYEQDGVTVRPVPQPSSRRKRMTAGVWGLLRPLLDERADIYHLHDPELMPLGIALRLCGRAVVYDAHEDLPSQVLGKQWIPKPMRTLVAGLSWLLVRTLGRGFDAVVAATPTVAQTFGGEHRERIDVVHNYPILADEGRFVPYRERPCDLVYVGGISRLRGLSTMLEVVRLVSARHREQVRLHLVGPFLHEGLESVLTDPELAGLVVHHGLLPPDEAREVMGRSRVGLALLERTKAHEDSIPNKLFEYMAEQLPVVASDFELWRQILEDTGAGAVVDPADAEAAADAVLKILANTDDAAAMATLGRGAVVHTYSWTSEGERLLARYDTILAGRRSRSTDR